jgi:hypothetical protein
VRTAAQRELAAKKSGGKRAKLERRLATLVDHVVISAPPAEDRSGHAEAAAGHRTVSAHWRRGHYRMQAHGPRNAERKLIFLRPMLVRGASAEAVQPRSYEVR